MKTEGFVKLLRKVIREEVRSAVREILSEERTNHKQVIDHGINLAEIAENPMPNRPKAKRKTYTKNGMLNDLLNETAATADFSSMKDPSFATMGGQFNSSMAQSFGASRHPQSLATHDTNGKPVDMSNENVAKTVDIMTKDYSALMKAIDKKKGK